MRLFAILSIVLVPLTSALEWSAFKDRFPQLFRPEQNKHGKIDGLWQK